MITIPEQLLSIGAVIIAAIFLALVSLLIKQNIQIRNLEKPKYGFLGKSLLAGIASILLVGGILTAIGQLNSTSQDAVDFTGGEFTVSLKLEKEVLASSIDTTTYRFSIIPQLGDQLFPAGPEEEYDVYWQFVGRETFAQREIKKSQLNPSEIVVTLEKGSYEVYALVIYDGVNYTLSETVVF